MTTDVDHNRIASPRPSRRLEIFTLLTFATTTVAICCASPLSLSRQTAILFLWLFTALEWERRRFSGWFYGARQPEAERSGVFYFDVCVVGVVWGTLARDMPSLFAPAFLGIFAGLFYLGSALFVYCRRYVPGLVSALLALIVGARVLFVVSGVYESPIREELFIANGTAALVLFFSMEIGAFRTLFFVKPDASPSERSDASSLGIARFFRRYALETETLAIFGLASLLSVVVVAPTYFQKACFAYLFLHTLHEWEASRFLGGAYRGASRRFGVEITEADIRSLRRVGFLFVVVMTVVPLAFDSPRLTLVPIYVGLLESAASLVFGVVFALRRRYFPGLTTGLALGFASVFFLSTYWRLRLATLVDYLVGAAFLVLLALFFAPIYRYALRRVGARAEEGASDSVDDA